MSELDGALSALLSYAIPTKTGFGSEKATIHRHNRMRGAVGNGS